MAARNQGAKVVMCSSNVLYPVIELKLGAVKKSTPTKSQKILVQ